MTAIYRLSRGVINPIARAAWRQTILGQGNIPMTGGVVFASNHLSFIDSFAIPIAAPRPVSFLAKDEYFTGSGVMGTAQRVFFRDVALAIPVDRQAPRDAQDSLDARAPDHATVGSIRGGRVWPGCRSPQVFRWCRSA